LLGLLNIFISRGGGIGISEISGKNAKNKYAPLDMLLPHITSLSIIQAINTTNPVISDTKIKKMIISLLLSKSFYL